MTTFRQVTAGSALAIAIAAAALAGCGSPRPNVLEPAPLPQAARPALAAQLTDILEPVPHVPARRAKPPMRAPEPEPAPAPRSPAPVRRPTARHTRPARDDRAAVSARVHAHLAARMREQEPTTRRRIARAIVSEAERAALDPLLVLALIHVESSFDPDVVSDAGAIGLMQLEEATFLGELERHGLDDADVTDPVANVRVGVRYLRRLVDAFGAMDVALMAYNAGPNRIRALLRQGEIPERIRAYPRKVNDQLDRLRGRRAPAPAQEYAYDK